ncbi:MAG: myo-inosose-2 dehydratase [Synergistaceae bacterium]|jgi:inosose dehydratase|nr:myo-inosose-2 dehydratase [Synergistaceae bacterium]
MNKSKVKLGIAPIGWTNDDMPELGSENTFEQCVSEMALAGFKGCEVGSKFPRHNPELLKRKLDARGLVICNAWFSTFFADGKKAETIENFTKHMKFLKFMGALVIGCSEQSGSAQGTDKPIFNAKKVFTEVEWQLVVAGYNEIAKIAEGEGMKVCLHHHMGTGVQTTLEIDRFMRETNGNVYLLYDTGHVYYSEGSQESVVKVLEDYLPRIVHVHLKDVRPEKVELVRREGKSFLDGVKMGTFTVPGDGVIDFAPVFDLLDKGDYSGWMVVEAEQDPAKADPFEYAVKAMEYIRKYY